MSDRLVELQEAFCRVVGWMCQEAYESNASDVAQAFHCSKADAEVMIDWGDTFDAGAIEPAHFKISPKLNVIKAILQAPDPRAALEWAMVNEAGSKAIKKAFGVPMTTQAKPTTVKGEAEPISEGVYKVVVSLDAPELPEQIEVRFKEGESDRSKLG